MDKRCTVVMIDIIFPRRVREAIEDPSKDLVHDIVVVTRAVATIPIRFKRARENVARESLGRVRGRKPSVQSACTINMTLGVFMPHGLGCYFALISALPLIIEENYPTGQCQKSTIAYPNSNSRRGLDSCVASRPKVGMARLGIMAKPGHGREGRGREEGHYRDSDESYA
ncbi:hypothetical protein BC834DRAFT_848741 [Gloeopeniophorella convolvens]|nr:hypothetical protein BC834DRAFT_848741 [Gloeopeniophorella convolvens]